MRPQLAMDAAFPPEEKEFVDDSSDIIQSGFHYPNCEAGKLDYDSLLELVCNECGFILANGVACT